MQIVLFLKSHFRLEIGNELIEKIPLMMVRITIHRASQSEKLVLTFKNMLVFLLKLGDAVAAILNEVSIPSFFAKQFQFLVQNGT